MRKGLEAGANDYFTKPVDFPMLFSRMRELIDQHTGGH